MDVLGDPTHGDQPPTDEDFAMSGDFFLCGEATALFAEGEDAPAFDRPICRIA